MCENDPPLPEPMCVQACKFDALIYEEREEEVEEEVEVKRGEMEIAFEALVKKHGLKKVKESFARFSKS
jgi:benzoyl-CoA reductase subunit BamC